MTVTLAKTIEPSIARSGGSSSLMRRLRADGESPDFSPWGRQSPLLVESKRPARASQPPNGEVIAPSRTAPNGKRPQLHPMKVLHRGHDGYIAFALKSDGKKFRPSFSIRASALETMFPGYVDMLTCDSYVSVNAAYTLSRRDTESDAGRPNHRNETLRYLCAAYCDIDLYKVGLTFNQGHAIVMDMCEAGILPWASMVVNSGKGMWLLWLLHDHGNVDRPHRGVFEDSGLSSLLIYSMINKEIGRRLKNLGSDPNATDGARYIRVPGSFRTDKEKTIWWSIQGDGDRGFSYTLTELADFFEVETRRLLPQEVEASAPRRVTPGRKNGQREANKSRLHVMVTLIALRGGGFREPYRDKGAWIYAMALYARGTPQGAAINAVREFGRNCEPPLSTSDSDAQTNFVYRHPGRWSYRKIAATLGVTKEEAEFISQRIGKVFPCADGTLVETVRADGKLKRSQMIAFRRDEEKRIISALGHVPAARKMEAMLKERGFEVGTYVTVLNDYKEIGLVTTRTLKLRQNKDHRIAQRSFFLPPAEGDQTRSSSCNWDS